jgi:hypothetical protein
VAQRDAQLSTEDERTGPMDQATLVANKKIRSAAPPSSPPPPKKKRKANVPPTASSCTMDLDSIAAAATASCRTPLLLQRIATVEDACGLELYACASAVDVATCRTVINLVSDKLFSGGEGGGIDGVDLQPCYQIDLIDPAPVRVSALPLKRRLFFLVVAPLLRVLRDELNTRFVPSCASGTPSLRLVQCFVRRYQPGERVELSTHRDMSQLTINVLLSDPAVDFSGGGCYIFGDSKHGTDSAADRERCRVMEGETQGAALIHSGQLLHGALPTTSGVRYILVLFFQLNGYHCTFVKPKRPAFKFDFVCPK